MYRAKGYIEIVANGIKRSNSIEKEIESPKAINEITNELLAWANEMQGELIGIVATCSAKKEG